MPTSLKPAIIDELRGNFLGELIQPGDPNYDESRKIWNGHNDRRPAVMARCRGAADVRAVVRFARDQDVLVSVRGGGHAVAGHALCDDGIVIDLSLMTGSRVDPAAQTIRVEGGCLNEHLDRESQAFGLATTSGIVSHTGVGGLTLGGGIYRVANESCPLLHLRFPFFRLEPIRVVARLRSAVELRKSLPVVVDRAYVVASGKASVALCH